jgi:hypothetical protein
MPEQTTVQRRFKMKATKTLIALAMAASFGFVTAAQAADAATPAATPAKTEATKPMVKKHHHATKKAATTVTAPAATVK